MDGEKHQERIECVGIKNGRSVEEPAAHEHLAKSLPGKRVGEHTPVDCQKHQAAYFINDVYNRHIDDETEWRGKQISL